LFIFKSAANQDTWGDSLMLHTARQLHINNIILNPIIYLQANLKYSFIKTSNMQQLTQYVNIPDTK